MDFPTRLNKKATSRGAFSTAAETALVSGGALSKE
jgi:hypothetical protein